MGDIIDENNKNMEKFFLCNLFFILFFILPLDSSNNLLLKIISSASYISLFSVFALAFKFSLSSECKYSLVYFKIDCPFPASHAFEDTIINDHRINKNILTTKYGILPRCPVEQNKLWYSILQKNNSFKVKTSYRDFLLLRDCNSLSIMFICFSVLLYFLTFISNLNIPKYAILGLTLVFVLEFVLFNISARKAGIRLVKIVLAEECSRVI